MYKNWFFVICLIFVGGLIGCSKEDPFSDNNLSKLYVDYMKSGGSLAGLRVFTPAEGTFYYDNIVEIKNFKKGDGREIDPTHHYVAFNFDTFYRVNASDVESKFPVDVLQKAFGEKYKDKIESYKKENFKAGDQKGKTGSLAMVLEKHDSGWKAVEVGLPNK